VGSGCQWQNFATIGERKTSFFVGAAHPFFLAKNKPLFWFVGLGRIFVDFRKDFVSNSAIDWKNPSVKISDFFSVGEVTKGDLRRIPVSAEIEQNILKLAFELDRVREEWGSGIVVTSWYRPIAVNRAVGGASNSQHIFGRAADIKPVNGDLLRFQGWLDQGWFGALGYGAKKGFVHLDMRNGKGWRLKGQKGPRWNY